jgi:hypothetical protein
MGAAVQAVSNRENLRNLQFLSSDLAGCYADSPADHNFLFKLNRYMNSGNLCRDAEAFGGVGLRRVEP